MVTFPSPGMTLGRRVAKEGGGELGVMTTTLDQGLF
jgi:hypothetical protein